MARPRRGDKVKAHLADVLSGAGFEVDFIDAPGANQHTTAQGHGRWEAFGWFSADVGRRADRGTIYSYDTMSECVRLGVVLHAGHQGPYSLEASSMRGMDPDDVCPSCRWGLDGCASCVRCGSGPFNVDDGV